MVMNVSRTDTIHGLWDELNKGIFPWIDDNIGELDSAPVEVRTRAANAKRRLVRIDPDQPPPSPITI